MNVVDDLFEVVAMNVIDDVKLDVVDDVKIDVFDDVRMDVAFAVAVADGYYFVVAVDDEVENVEMFVVDGDKVVGVAAAAVVDDVDVDDVAAVVDDVAAVVDDGVVVIDMGVVAVDVGKAPGNV
nr:8689_t:CDS:2 [Entrophospora candida]